MLEQGKNVMMHNSEFADCFTSKDSLVVYSKSKTFKSAGEFDCANGKNLYFTNGTQLKSISTTCLATARWSGENEVVCFEGNFIYASY